MRRKDKEISREKALEIVDKCEYATLALVDDASMPYCVTLNVARDNENIYFHCATEGKKVELMRKNPKVCLNSVIGKGAVQERFTYLYASAVVFGTAQEIVNEDEKWHGLKVLCEKYTPDNMANFEIYTKDKLARTAVWCVHIDEISGKSNIKD